MEAKPVNAAVAEGGPAPPTQLSLRQLERHLHNQQREMEDLRNERKNFYHFLKSEGGKDLVKKYKVFALPLFSYDGVTCRLCVASGVVRRSIASCRRGVCVLPLLARVDRVDLFPSRRVLPRYCFGGTTTTPNLDAFCSSSFRFLVYYK